MSETDKVDAAIAADANELVKKETDKLVGDVEEVTKHAEIKVDEVMKKIDDDVKDLHADAKNETEEIKEEIKEHITLYARFIGIALYACGCIAALLKRKETNADVSPKDETSETSVFIESPSAKGNTAPHNEP
jgi:hypothetical protein